MHSIELDNAGGLLKMKETYSFWFCNDVKIQIDMYTNETSEAG